MELDPDDIKIIWPDPIVTGGREEVETVIMAVDSGLMDRVDAVQRINHVTREEAQRIADEGEQREREAQEREQAMAMATANSRRDNNSRQSRDSGNDSRRQ